MGKVFVLKLDGDFERGFRVTLEIGEDGESRWSPVTGELPPTPEISQLYKSWQKAFHSLGSRFRVEWEEEEEQTEASVVRSSPRVNSSCKNFNDQLRKSINDWLDSDNFRCIKDWLLTESNRFNEARVIIQTNEKRLWQLPWGVWNFFDKFPNAGVALSTIEHIPVKHYVPNTPRDKVRILAILGNRTGINVEADRRELKNLPEADIEFLDEPQRSAFEALWDDSWDILYFAGHSKTEGEEGIIHFNQKETLRLGELKDTLRRAIQNGLKLAIFNSCQGLGLAYDLASLHIPQVIVMREPVPDEVAQEFLKYFLKAFSSGRPLYAAVRDAQAKLRELRRIEERFPGASWLPVICQNLAEVPLTWQQLCCSTGTPGTVEQKSTAVGTNSESNPAQAQTTNKQNLSSSGKQENKKTRLSQPSGTQSTPKSPQSQEPPKPLPKPKNLADVINGLPKGKEYPVYQVFGVIYSFYQYGIAIPAEILLLCLPEYTKTAVEKVVKVALNKEKELKDLVIVITQRKFQGLGTSNKLSPKKAIQEVYRHNSLEKYLTAAIPALDATKETHQRWTAHAMRSLAVNGQDNLVRKILLEQEYRNQIQSLQPKGEEGSNWVEIYKAVLQKHPEDASLRSKYLGVTSQCGTAQQKQKAIDETTTWLQQHPEDKSVRRTYLGVVSRCGTPEQKRDAIAETTTWLKTQQQQFNKSIADDAQRMEELTKVLKKAVKLALDNDIKDDETLKVASIFFDRYRDYLSDKHADNIAELGNRIHRPERTQKQKLKSQFPATKKVIRKPRDSEGGQKTGGNWGSSEGGRNTGGNWGSSEGGRNTGGNWGSSEGGRNTGGNWRI